MSKHRVGVKDLLGLQLPDSDIDLLFKEFDADGGGSISAGEFISTMARFPFR